MGDEHWTEPYGFQIRRFSRPFQIFFLIMFTIVPFVSSDFLMESWRWLVDGRWSLPAPRWSLAAAAAATTTTTTTTTSTAPTAARTQPTYLSLNSRLPYSHVEPREKPSEAKKLFSPIQKRFESKSDFFPISKFSVSPPVDIFYLATIKTKKWVSEFLISLSWFLLTIIILFVFPLNNWRPQKNI